MKKVLLEQPKPKPGAKPTRGGQSTGPTQTSTPPADPTPTEGPTTDAPTQEPTVTTSPYEKWATVFKFTTQDNKEVAIRLDNELKSAIEKFKTAGFDDDDAFVRAVVETYPKVTYIFFLKGTADIKESVTENGSEYFKRTLCFPGFKFGIVISIGHLRNQIQYLHKNSQHHYQMSCNIYIHLYRFQNSHFFPLVILYFC
jgi:hypothetical protein